MTSPGPFNPASPKQTNLAARTHSPGPPGGPQSHQIGGSSTNISTQQQQQQHHHHHLNQTTSSVTQQNQVPSLSRPLSPCKDSVSSLLEQPIIPAHSQTSLNSCSFQSPHQPLASAGGAHSIGQSPLAAVCPLPGSVASSTQLTLSSLSPANCKFVLSSADNLVLRPHAGTPAGTRNEPRRRREVFHAASKSSYSVDAEVYHRPSLPVVPGARGESTSVDHLLFNTATCSNSSSNNQNNRSLGELNLPQAGQGVCAVQVASTQRALQVGSQGRLDLGGQAGPQRPHRASLSSVGAAPMMLQPVPMETDAEFVLADLGRSLSDVDIGNYNGRQAGQQEEHQAGYQIQRNESGGEDCIDAGPSIQTRAPEITSFNDRITAVTADEAANAHVNSNSDFVSSSNIRGNSSASSIISPGRQRHEGNTVRFW